MDLEATKFFKGPRGSLLCAVALICFAVASALLVSSLQTRHAASSHLDQRIAISSADSFMPRRQTVASRSEDSFACERLSTSTVPGLRCRVFLWHNLSMRPSTQTSRMGKLDRETNLNLEAMLSLEMGDSFRRLRLRH